MTFWQVGVDLIYVKNTYITKMLHCLLAFFKKLMKPDEVNF